jgi:hypothetical protein
MGRSTVDGCSGQLERGAHLLQHLLLPGAHLLGARQQVDAIGDLVTNHPGSTWRATTRRCPAWPHRQRTYHSTPAEHTRPAGLTSPGQRGAPEAPPAGQCPPTRAIHPRRVACQPYAIDERREPRSPLIQTIRASVIGDHEEMEPPAAELRVPDGHIRGGDLPGHDPAVAAPPHPVMSFSDTLRCPGRCRWPARAANGQGERPTGWG